jgi:hypothetical protein
MTTDHTTAGADSVADIDLVWWQALADRLGQTLLVLRSRGRIDGSTEGCLTYGVYESDATGWEKRNAVARIVPGTAP